MLYVFHGADVAQAGVKARALVASLRAKRPDAAFEKVDSDGWNSAIIEGHLGGQGLFSNKYIVFLDRVTENAEAKDEIVRFIPAMQESPNIFIAFEGKLNAELKKAFDKSAEKVVECEKKAAAAGGFKASGPNVFALGDAVAKRDVFKAWSLYRQAIDGGAEPEAILGMLFWKAKTMQAKDLARELVTLYHDGHRGLVDLELGTERLVLKCGR
jgi:DNA polymerase III delta subunit